MVIYTPINKNALNKLYAVYMYHIYVIGINEFNGEYEYVQKHKNLLASPVFLKPSWNRWTVTVTQEIPPDTWRHHEFFKLETWIPL